MVQVPPPTKDGEHTTQTEVKTPAAAPAEVGTPIPDHSAEAEYAEDEVHAAYPLAAPAEI